MTPPETPAPKVGGLPFRKMHGIGNDFVVIDARAPDVAEMTPALARAIGDRRFGVGFDQMAVIQDTLDDAVAAEIEFWNADGTTAGACGNATRCIAELLMTEMGRDGLTLRTERGLLACRRRPDGGTEVDMGAPRFGWEEIPLSQSMDTTSVRVGIPRLYAKYLADAAAVNMGNPHCVFFVEDAEAEPVETLGPQVETHPLFPERCNVSFAEIRDRETVRLRVWERGVGVTLACGSAACAVLAAGVRRDLLEREARIQMDGGVLGVAWPSDDGGVLLSGPTESVFEAHLSPEFLARVAAEARWAAASAD